MPARPEGGPFGDGEVPDVFRAMSQRPEFLAGVMSILPVQFSDGNDLATYPRDFERDAALAEAEGVDVIFAPSADEMYPARLCDLGRA